MQVALRGGATDVAICKARARSVLAYTELNARIERTGLEQRGAQVVAGEVLIASKDKV